jgi:hypothetical protein
MIKKIHWKTAKKILKLQTYRTDPNYVSGDMLSVEKAYQMLKSDKNSTHLLKTGAVIGYNDGFYIAGYAMSGSDVTDLFI